MLKLFPKSVAASALIGGGLLLAQAPELPAPPSPAPAQAKAPPPAPAADGNAPTPAEDRPPAPPETPEPGRASTPPEDHQTFDEPPMDDAAAQAETQQRAALGVSLDESAEGVVVRDVSPNSPAARAGLQPGDRILRVDGQDFDQIEAFSDEIAMMPTDREIEIIVLRGDQERPLNARLDLWDNVHFADTAVSRPYSAMRPVYDDQPIVEGGSYEAATNACCEPVIAAPAVDHCCDPCVGGFAYGDGWDGYSRRAARRTARWGW